ncbi:MAG: APA family basic amino acid/polyamine antiporter [Polyangiales bacterium]
MTDSVTPPAETSSRRLPDPSPAPESSRTIGLLGATYVGVGAIVGGGILVLGGVAFQETGPSAIIAFAINGVIAILTALSFAEMSSTFPESGGAYTFAKKVLSVRMAFGVGWILWFAYIVAGVLYALGFASYAMVIIKSLWEIAFGPAPSWLVEREAVVTASLVATAFYTVGLIRKGSGGGRYETIGKVVLFVVLIIVGAWAIVVAPSGSVVDALTPFFAGGATGLVSAMGFTFIALQGFDLIAAVAGEVKNPAKVIPRAMLLSLGAALAIYLPLLFVVSTVGTEPGQSLGALSREHPETFMAIAVRNYMGPIGYWLVMIAAVLSTLSALQANLMAASRVALSMGEDRTLPHMFARKHRNHGTPAIAIYASALALVAILLMVDLSAAGAAASLIFLVCFALVHGTAILARRRSRITTTTLSGLASPVGEAPYQTPWFPLVPVLGGGACLVMAVFQAVTVPEAGYVGLVWIGLGVLLYLAVFSSGAEKTDAFAEGHDPHLLKMRGRSPLVLVPIRNPNTAPAMVALASALAPRSVGRVLLLFVMERPDKVLADTPPKALVDAQKVLEQALTASLFRGHAPEALVTVAKAPFDEIKRVAKIHRCESLLLGLTEDPASPSAQHLEELINHIECQVAILHAKEGFELDEATEFLVPVGGRGRHHDTRARLLGSLFRSKSRNVTYLAVVPADSSHSDIKRRERSLERFAREEVPVQAKTVVVASDDVVMAITEEAKSHQVVVLGLATIGGRRSFGKVASRIARETTCATILVGAEIEATQQVMDGLKRLPGTFGQS